MILCFHFLIPQNVRTIIVRTYLEKNRFVWYYRDNL